MNKYRIIKDAYAGYEVQKRYWWFPFWISRSNTFPSIDRAKEFIQILKSKPVHEE